MSFPWAAEFLFLKQVQAVVWIVVLTALTCTQLASAQSSPSQQASQLLKTAPQTQQVIGSYEGQNVSAVDLAGQPDLDTSQLAPLLLQRAGQPFSRKKVEQTVAALEHTGKFERVSFEVQPEPTGVRIIFTLEPAIYYGMFQFPGAVPKFTYSRLVQIANYPPRGAYDFSQVQQAVNALRRFFNRNGYFLAHVQPELQQDQQHGLVNVIFRTALGKRAKFGVVNIEGPSSEKSARLRRDTGAVLARLRGAAIRPGKTYNVNTLQRSTQYLQNTLAKQGYLAAKVNLIGANYNPETNRADISFKVQTGPVVHVKVEGTHLWPWTRKNLLPIYAQIGVDPELIQEGSQNLVSYFQSKGYFDTKVDSNVQQEASGETIIYRVSQGQRHKVAQVSISGNKQFSDKELMPQLSVQKAHFFSHGSFSQKLVTSSAKHLESYYQAAGFSSVKVTPQVNAQSDNIAVTFQVEEGPRDFVETLRIEGNSTLTQAQFAPRGLKLEPGRPYSQQFADEDRNQIMVHYLNLGYLTANFHETVKAIPKQPHRLEVTYHVYEGPRVEAANIYTLGRTHSDQRLIERNISGISPGKALTETSLFTSQSNLYNVGVFDWAGIDPRRQITTQTQEDIVIKVHEAPRNRITYGLGFEVVNRGGSVPSGTVAVPGLPSIGLSSKFKTSQSTFWGPRGTFQYTRSDLRGKNESLSLTAFAGRLDQRGSIVYINPNLRWTNWSADALVSGEHNGENPIFSSRILQFNYELKHPLNPDKTQTFFVRYSYNDTALTNVLIPQLVPAADLHTRLSSIAASYIRDTRDNVLDAHKGIYETADVSLNPTALGSNVNFAKLTAQAAYYKMVRDDIVWANSVRIGLAQPFAGSHVPISQKFFSGGGSTLRGFPLEGAGPQHTIPACGNPADPSTCTQITVPTGGNELLIINSELRIPVPIKKGLGIAAFYDGGNVFPSVGFHRFGSLYSHSVGVGLRYATPVGPIRIDIGRNLNPVTGVKATQFFITLGQAF